MGAPAAPDLLVEALLVWLRKSGASILSNASMSSLPRASNKRRTKVLFCSASDDTVASSLFSFCQVAFLLLSGWATTSMMPPRGVGRIDREAYSPKCVEGEFCEVGLPLYGVLG